MTERVHELWERIKPYAMHEIEKLVNLQKRNASSEGRGEIILYRLDGKAVRYEANEDGLRAAVSGAGDDEVVYLPPLVITLTQALFISRRIAIFGSNYEQADLSVQGTELVCSTDVGSYLLSNNQSTGRVELHNLVISYMVSSTASRTALLLGGGVLSDVRIYAYNAAGGAVALSYNRDIYLERVVGFAKSEGSGAAIGLTAASANTTGKVSINLCGFEGRSNSGTGTGAVLVDNGGTVRNSQFVGNSLGLKVLKYGGGG